MGATASSSSPPKAAANGYSQRENGKERIEKGKRENKDCVRTFCGFFNGERKNGEQNKKSLLYMG